ncbi:hypothetical protein NF27_KF00040 [Candidatus Jidaibacter acanthamoeba]|uniref:Uncharacterized protein n=1 Tax=Candidatus Jidaibacter acanthamoebae TaxID=86105 RepID=A0A0C1MW23_9RICK|nr:hypothetical protein NF27_KF00040 [Candidatus Jidaibacter acanthamoeba]
MFIEFNNQADFALFKLFWDDTYPGLILEYSYGASDIDGTPVKIKMDAQIFYEEIIPALSEFKQAEELENNFQLRSFRRSLELSSSSSSDNENCLLM